MAAQRGFTQRLLKTGALLFASLVLASCGKESAEPLRVASSPWPGYEPVYLARDIGYLPKDKANVFELPSSDITLESFRNHSADMATLTLDETLELLSGGVRLRVLFVMDTSNGADAVMATPDIRTLADLKGRRIAIENIPLGIYMLTRTLEAAKLTRDDVHIIPSAENKHAEMYRQGKADAFITFDPFKAQLADMGAHVIFDSSKIPNEILDLMVVHEDVYLARREEVCDVARQWFRSLEYMKQSPEDASQRIAKRLGVSVTQYQSMVGGIATPALEGNLHLLAGASPAIVIPANNLLKVMLKEGQIRRRVDIRQALDADIGKCLSR